MNILDVIDSIFIKDDKCTNKDCPSDELLRLYPSFLDEEIFDVVDEKIYYCQRCKDRLKNKIEIDDIN